MRQEGYDPPHESEHPDQVNEDIQNLNILDKLNKNNPKYTRQLASPCKQNDNSQGST